MRFRKSHMGRVPATALHAVLAPGAHRNVGNLVDEPLLRGWLARTACNSRPCCKILGLNLDLCILRRLARHVLADRCIDRRFIRHISRLLLSFTMRAIYWSKGTYARRVSIYRGRAKPDLAFIT